VFQKTIDINAVVLFSSRVHAQIIIPARLNSGRLPEKVLIEVASKPILQHVWERAREADLGGEPIVATDDERVAGVARGFGAKVVMTSPDHLCGSERVAEVARKLDAGLIINLQADEVLIEPGLLATLPPVFADPGVQMATVVTKLGGNTDIDSPSIVKAVLDDNQDVLYFSRSSIPFPAHTGNSGPPVYGHVGVYAFRREFLIEMYARPQGSLEKSESLEQLRVLQAGHRIRSIVCKTRHLGLNTPEDLRRIRTLLENQ
jgi:3-deoxy-manno-octulosonate cytidylyltransferase (CMP-KDO synthetase)